MQDEPGDEAVAGLPRVLGSAKAVVIQVMGAHNLSNRYYSVHPRRNDRFLRASPTLASLYPEVDFTEFHFTRHMLSRLETISEKRSATVFKELKSAWIARMTALCALIPGPVLLLWISDRLPPDRADVIDDGEPLLVTREMLEALRPQWTEANATLGGTRADYWMRIGFPVLAPSFIGSLLLLFANAFSSYATAAALISQGSQIVPLQIRAALTSETVLGRANLAGSLALGMVIVMVVVMSLYALLERRATRWQR